MGGLGDHAGEMIYILLAILLIVAVMVIVMTLSRVAKKNTNNKVSELNQQVGNIDSQFYEDWDMGVISGAQLKSVVQQAKDKDCAILVSTLSWLGVQPMIEGVTIEEDAATTAETSFNGTALLESYDSQLPVVKVSLVDANSPHKEEEGAFPVKTALGTEIDTPLFVNYGSILKNAVLESGVSGEAYTSILTTEGDNGSYTGIEVEAAEYDTASDTGQEIAYKDGRFYTKLEFATSQNSEVLRYDATMDWNSRGRTMYISDTSSFKSYILCSPSGEYLGLVFVEKR